MNTIEMMTAKTLIDIGVNPGLSGYDYLCTAIPLAYKDKTYIRQITKKLYPEIAERYGSNTSRVERAIRHAIETTFLNTDIDVLKKYFGNTVNVMSGKVTNTTFIATVTEYIRMQLEADGVDREVKAYAQPIV